MDYFVWAVVGERQHVGGRHRLRHARRGAARDRRLLRTAAEALATRRRRRTRRVTDVILTHLHYDHAGGLEHFPNARFHVQDREMAFATGRHMTDAGAGPRLHRRARRRARAPRARRARGVPRRRRRARPRAVGAPPRWPHRRDAGRAGRDRPRARWCSPPTRRTTTRTSRPGGRSRSCSTSTRWWRAGRRSGGSRRVRDAIVPGHDPLVLERYPAASRETDGVAVRLDEGRR